MDIDDRMESLQLDMIQQKIKKLKKEIKKLKKERKEKLHPLFTLLKQWISVDIATLICNEYIDFNFCWKCNSMYSKYGHCLHKVLSGKKQSYQISAFDCAKFVSSDEFSKVEVAFPNARDKTIWQYLVSQLFENHYSLKIHTTICDPNTIRYNLKLVIHKNKEQYLINLYHGEHCVYFAMAELCQKI